MTLRALAMLAMATAYAGAAPVPKELKKATDAERIQGVWSFVGYDNGGPQNTGARWFFDKNKLYVGGLNTVDNKGSPFDFVLRAKPEASQTEIDFDCEPRNRWRGIYKFVGEELHVAYVMDADRPKDFSSAHGKFIMVMKRVPKPKK